MNLLQSFSVVGDAPPLANLGLANLDTLTNLTISFKYGDLLRLQCKNLEPPKRGPSSTVCGADGNFYPDALLGTGFGFPTVCEVVFCEYRQLPLGSHALLDSSVAQELETNATAAEVKVFYATAIPKAEAPSTFLLGCAIDAQVLIVDTIDTSRYTVVKRYSPKMECDYVSKAWLMGDDEQQNAYRIGNTSTIKQWFDLKNMKCQCMQGRRRGDGDRVAECAECPDNTYAPINALHERVECRACPREGVTCTEGILTVWKDWWFDVPPTLLADGENRLGMKTDTSLYKCSDRLACLPNKTSVPMTMYCDENHTSVMCARCYHRREDCDRGVIESSKVGTCVPPAYLQRGPEWMYFAKIARHCERCPSGKAANVSYIVTALVAVGMLVAICFLVLSHLHNTETRLREMVRGETTRANTTGPIARLLLNWMQATALLTAIKFTPPDAVQEVGVWAEYAQGISTKSFIIRCALRWDYYLTFAFELINPIISCIVPALLVIIIVPIKRRLKGWWLVRKYNYERWSKISQSEKEQLNFNRLRTAAKNAEKRKLAKEAALRREKKLRERGIFEVIGSLALPSPTESGGVAAEHLLTEDGQHAMFQENAIETTNAGG